MAASSEHIFISYNSADEALAYELAAMIDARVCRAWIAPRDARPGIEYSEQLHEAVKTCAAFVVLVSEASNASDFVLAETEIAFSNRRPIYPVRVANIQPTSGFAFFLRLRQWTDAFGRHRRANLERLIRELSALTRRPQRRRRGPGITLFGPRGSRLAGPSAEVRPAAMLALAAIGGLGILLALILLAPASSQSNAAATGADPANATATGSVAGNDAAAPANPGQLIAGWDAWARETAPPPPPDMTAISNDVAMDGNAASSGDGADPASNVDGM